MDSTSRGSFVKVGHVTSAFAMNRQKGEGTADCDVTRHHPSSGLFLAFPAVRSIQASAVVVERLPLTIAGPPLPLSVDMAETEETHNCVRLGLSDGGYVYLRSIWQTTKFSITVFDGFQAWFRCVSTKEVANMARQWNIGVAEVMRSARARLSCQYSTSSYFMSVENDANFLSFTIDDLWEGEALDFKLRIESISDPRAIVCEMLDHLTGTIVHLKEQLTEAEIQPMKKPRQVAGVSEPEPSVSLSFARSSCNNPRRQNPSFLEPRLLDFSKVKSEMGLTRMHDLHDTNKSASTWQPPSFNANDHGVAKPTTDSNLETEREVTYFHNPVTARRSRMNRNNDVTAKIISLPLNLKEVLKSLSNGIDGRCNLLDCGDEEVDVGAGDERGLKIAEARNPRSEDQPQRSSVMHETNSVSPTLLAQALQRNIMTPESNQADIARDAPQSVKRSKTMMGNSAFSGKKKFHENHNGVSGRHPEKSTSAAGDQVKRKFAAEVEANGAGSDEEARNNKATLEDAHLQHSVSYSNIRSKPVLPTPLLPRGQALSEAKITEEKHENFQDLENDNAPETVSPESRSSERQESLTETTGKQSSAMQERVWDKAVVATPSVTKRAKVMESYTEDEEDAEHEGDEERLVYSRQRNTCSRHLGRKRTVEEREGSQGFGPVRSEDENFDLRGAPFAGRRIRSSSTVVDQDVVDLDDYREEVLTTAGKPKMKPGSAEKNQDGHSAGHSLATLIRLKHSIGDLPKPRHAQASFPPSEMKDKFGDRDGGTVFEEKNVTEPSMPDADYYNFDKDRTEDLVKPDQIWAVYAEKDEMPRSYARIDKVSSFPKFKASITWLRPHQLSEKAKKLSELSGLTISCGEFEFGGRDTLPEINCFSHRMAVAAAAGEVVKIYPRRGEIWALFKNMAKHNDATSSRPGMSKGSRFRVAAIVEDVEAGKRPKICVLGKVPGFRTVWKVQYEKGKLPTPDLSLFSHRVPAYRLHGLEVNGKILHYSWDIDQAGLSACDSQIDP